MCAQGTKREGGAHTTANEEMNLMVADYWCHKFHYVSKLGSCMSLVSTQITFFHSLG